MAYLNRLYSVPLSDIEAVREKADATIAPSFAVSVSHLVAYWVQVQPLGQLLGQAIDGGAMLSGTLRHKLRDPCYHEPEAVRLLSAELAEAWEQAIASHPVGSDDWYRMEIEKVLRLYAHATEHGECVVSVLDPCTSIRVKLPN